MTNQCPCSLSAFRIKLDFMLGLPPQICVFHTVLGTKILVEVIGSSFQEACKGGWLSGRCLCSSPLPSSCWECGHHTWVESGAIFWQPRRELRAKAGWIERSRLGSVEPPYHLNRFLTRKKKKRKTTNLFRFCGASLPSFFFFNRKKKKKRKTTNLFKALFCRVPSS